MNTDMQTKVPGSASGHASEEWRSALYEAAAEVFEMMVGEPVSRLESSAPDGANDTTAMVGLAGSLCGVLSIRCSTSSAAGIASKMLGEPEQSTACVEQQLDALGEICNMVAGNFKARVEGLGRSACSPCPPSSPGRTIACTRRPITPAWKWRLFSRGSRSFFASKCTASSRHVASRQSPEDCCFSGDWLLATDDRFPIWGRHPVLALALPVETGCRRGKQSSDSNLTIPRSRPQGGDGHA